METEVLKRKHIYSVERLGDNIGVWSNNFGCMYLLKPCKSVGEAERIMLSAASAGQMSECERLAHTRRFQVWAGSNLMQAVIGKPYLMACFNPLPDRTNGKKDLMVFDMLEKVCGYVTRNNLYAPALLAGAQGNMMDISWELVR